MIHRLPSSLWPTVHLLATGQDWPPRSAASAECLYEACLNHGLLPLLFAARGLPAPLSGFLQSRRAVARVLDAQSDRLARAAEAVAATLGREPFVFLKGTDYGRRLYGDPRLRPMQDIDVLVPIERYSAACRLLEERGLQTVFPGTPATRDWSYYQRAFRDGDVIVEVHQTFLQSPRHRVDYRGLWERIEREPETGRLRLADVDALAYHAVNLGADLLGRRLVRYVDLWMLVHLRPGIVVEAAARARAWRAARAFYGMLRQGCRLFPEMETDETREAMTGVLPSWERRLVDRWLLPREDEWRPEGVPRRLVQVIRKFALMDNLRRRTSFLAFHVRADLRGRWLRTSARPSA
ncbi:MAG TPA: nucleotidyltransferase family protein [Vicinamibacteria bacterium]|nr:nucleotidyltransferase family protein [Vicinamibacteria bacterium]